jgi:hypothetical protein
LISYFLNITPPPAQANGGVFHGRAGVSWFDAIALMPL